MPKRLLTLLLLLTVLVPTSLLGSTLHHCGMVGEGTMDGDEMPHCCVRVFSESRDGDGVVQLTHRCEPVSGVVQQQPAATTLKAHYDAPNPAEIPAEFVFLQPLSDFLSQFPARALYFPLARSQQPVFLRNCSFLI